MLKAKQIKAIEMLISSEFTYEEIAAELKITPKTLYNWRQDEDFCTELRRKMRLRISNLAPKALKKMEKLIDAKSEMVAHLSAKDILDRAGYEEETTVNLNSVAAVQIVDDIPQAAGGGTNA